MYHLTLMTICCLLICCCVEAAFKDFVIGAESKERVNQNDLSFGCEAEEEQEQQLMDLQDMMQEGIGDTQQLLSVLLQHAQRLGLCLEQFAQLHSMEHADPFDAEVGCSAAESLSYGEQPSWYDVFFN
ncbi:uncharacterized protein LOC117782757 [Drosophila innubila]|uniref:uncharacterized protein LOC117782757 n=1 Tax=Drosophila innubila TaxID=198719 RepID=UPI00148D1E90|nr:uncharacterized protein LOC117782757 [Drosophila innubila]